MSYASALRKNFVVPKQMSKKQKYSKLMSFKVKIHCFGCRLFFGSISEFMEHLKSKHSCEKTTGNCELCKVKVPSACGYKVSNYSLVCQNCTEKLLNDSNLNPCSECSTEGCNHCNDWGCAGNCKENTIYKIYCNYNTCIFMCSTCYFKQFK